jgi:hypothetical protein
MRYGQLDFTDEVIGNFEGDLDISVSIMDKLLPRYLKEIEPIKRDHTSVDSRDAKMHHLYARVSSTGGHKAHLDLSTEINYRMRMDHVFEQFGAAQVYAQGLQENGEEFPQPTKYECLRTLMDSFEESCGRMDDYSLKFVKYLVRECENLPEIFSMKPSIDRLKISCQH